MEQILGIFVFFAYPRPPPLPAQASYLSVFLVFVGRGDKTTKASKSGKLKGGGGAARSVLNGLVFLRDHLELQLPVDDTDVRSSGVDAPVARRGQATPASPQVLRALGTLAASRNKIVSFFAQATIVMIRGGLRFEHSRRSTLESCSEDGAWFVCSMGKKRKDGQPAPPFRFYVPEVRTSTGPFPKGLVSNYCARLRRLFKDAKFMQPALWPPSASVFRHPS